MCLAGIPYRLKGRVTVYARGRPGRARIPDGTHVRNSFAGRGAFGVPGAGRDARAARPAGAGGAVPPERAPLASLAWVPAAPGFVRNSRRCAPGPIL